MTFFPQIYSNAMITQLPYTLGNSWETIVQDVETGARFAFPRRGAGLDGYPENPRFRAVLNYTSITDAEVATLGGFFKSMRGRWGRFSFLDPGGNLVQDSEPSSGSPDPYGHSDGMSAVGSSALIGPAGGGLNGFVLNVSVYCYATSSSQSVTIGFTPGGTRTVALPANSWLRADYTGTVSGGGAVHASISSFSGYQYGLQCSPTKGPGGYVKSPGNYGYHEVCRFDSDVFEVVAQGPNQSMCRLPIVEIFTGS